MAVNGGAVNTGAVNAAFGPPPAPTVQIPFNLSNTVNDPPLPVVLIPLNASNEANQDFDDETIYPLPMIVDVESFVYDMTMVVESIDVVYQMRWGVESADIELELPLMTVVEIDLNLPLAILDFDDVENEVNLSLPLTVNIDLDLPLGLIDFVENQVEYEMGLNDTVERDLNLPLALGILDKVETDITYIMPLLEETPLEVTGALKLVIDATGEEVDVISGNVAISENSYLWSGSVRLFTPSDLNKFGLDEPVTVSIYGEDWTMLVVRKSGGKSGATGISAQLELQSRTVNLSTPRAAATSLEFPTPVFAEAAAEALVGTTIDWQIIDWAIPGGRLSGEGSNPIEIVQTIAKAAGATLESNPDSTLYVRDLYPTRVADYATATPAHVYEEGPDILSFNEQTDFQEIFNKFRIRNSQDSEGRDTIELELSEDGLSAIARVYTRPDRDIDLVHTSDANILITDLGIEEVTDETCPEFKDGKASLSRPILAIDSVEWLDDDLGAINFTQFETDITSTVVAFGLAKITWRARARKFRVTTPVADKVQLLVCDPN